MSIPPHLIRVKRKRVEETPVAFLQLDQGTKRHRSGSNWVYQRRGQATPSAPNHDRAARPIIHVSNTEDEPSPAKKRHAASTPTQDGASLAPKQKSNASLVEPRRFHISRAMLAASAAQNAAGLGVSKKARYGPALFVERSRRRMPSEPRSSLGAQRIQNLAMSDNASESGPQPNEVILERPLKRPGIASKPRTPEPEPGSGARTPLPPSVLNRHHDEDMDRIAADMNQWVLNEIGANLQSMEDENKKQAERASRFKPKAPAARYSDRNPQSALPSHLDKTADTVMTDASEDEGDDEDWVVEEYVRVPANFMTVDVTPADIGVLVLDGEEENNLFYGPLDDEDDEFAEDDEDENAENHYTADYPEDEVDSDDEFNRHAYLYRNGNASDDEEYDNDVYEDNDDMVLEGDGDDDARMDRIRQYVQRNAARP